MFEIFANLIDFFGRYFNRGTKKVVIQTGRVYHRLRANNTVETATVLEINEDHFGIPHVKFKVTMGRSDRSLFWECMRVLALEAFAEMYAEVAGAEVAGGKEMPAGKLATTETT